MSVPVGYCARCEGPLLQVTALLYIGPDGTFGHIARLLCPECFECWAAPGAEPVIEGQVDRDGLDALLWFVRRRADARGAWPGP